MTNNTEHTDSAIVPDMEQIIESIKTSKSQHQNGGMQLAQLFMQKLDGLQQTAELDAQKTEFIERKIEALARQFENITSQFINENVKQPWIKELVEVCESLQTFFPQENEGVDPELIALTNKIERRLTDADVTWISPDIAVPFKPTCHKAVEAQVTPDQSLHGCVAKVFRKGFAIKDHPVKYAQVSVFKYQPQS